MNNSLTIVDQVTQEAPDYVVLDPNGIVTIETSDEAFVDEHILVLTFLMGNDTLAPSSISQEFKLTILTGIVEVQNDITSATTPLVFADTLTTYFNITYEDYWEYYLPAVAEDETSDLEHDIEITVSSASDLISYE